MPIVAGINGFGRFSLHLLRYWLDRHHDAGFRIDFINDDVLTLEQSYAIITGDKHVRFEGVKIDLADDALVVQHRDGTVQMIRYTNAPQREIPWIGQPQLVFECSGKYTVAERCSNYLTGDTELVMISATSWDADKTIVYGYNHEQFQPGVHRTISYGSCTVNAYVPLANWLQQAWGVVDSDVNVVHNIVAYRLHQHNTLLRKPCTLERSAPLLLPFVEEDNFVVTYSVVPWDGVSMIDFRFRLERPPAADAVVDELRRAVSEGPLQGLYGLDNADLGPQVHNCTPFSTVFIGEGIKLRRDNLYLQGYFDTENSVNRFFDVARHVAARLAG